MLTTLFHWLDLNPGVYWWLAGLATLLVAVHVWSVVRVEVGGAADSRRGVKRDALVLFLFLLAWRWPFFLVGNEFNPDESQLVAGALTLSHDSVFWRSVDGTTSGPLNFYLLVPFHWLGMPIDYFTARLAGLLLVFGALFATHLTLAGKFGRAGAWLGVLPAAGFFATATYLDLIHYSSEHLTLFMTALAIWLLTPCSGTDRKRRWLACFVAGAMIWAKLQAAPLSVALVVWACWQLFDEPRLGPKLRWRRLAEVGLAALAPTLIAATLIAVTGQMEAAVRRYVLQNMLYVGDARPLAVALREMYQLALKDGRLPLLIATAIALGILGTGYFVFRRLRPPPLFGIGAWLILAAGVAIVAPRREYLHYALLLPIPLTVWLGSAIGGWWKGLTSARDRWALAGLVFLLAGLPPIVTRCLQPRPEIFGRFEYNWRHPRTSAAVLVRALTDRGESVAVWGWASNLYVESGRPQATRDAHSIWSIQENAQRDYYRACYLDDLRRHTPPVLVDAVGPGAFSFENRATQANEIFPELAEYVRENYSLVADLGDARVYARNGLSDSRGLTPARIAVLVAQGRLTEQERASAMPSPLTQLDGFQRKIIAQREVVMLLPPTQVAWALPEDVRAVSFEFGFDPVAYEQGKSNGAALFLEVADDHGLHLVFQCVLDPARVVDDRAPHRVYVPLPPFSSGARLVLRSDPGQYGDTAWDWIYLANLQFRR